jgi:hypothetical protein
MRKLSFMLTMVFGLMMCLSVKAQSPIDYFVGKWNVTIVGTPNGDAKLNFLFEKKDGKLGGAVQDSTGKEISKISKIDTAGKTITAAFVAEGYDVTMTLEPVDEQNVKGSVMGMFDAKGVRVKETGK